MSMDIKIKTGNVTETWWFDEKYWFPKIVLTNYAKTEIPKGKRTPMVIAAWSKDLRELREWEYIGIAIAEPNIPTEIRRMAIEKLTSQLEVVNWTGRKP